MANDNYDDDDDDSSVCKVYDKDDFFTVVVQILLAIFALLSLYIKRLQEVPRRTLKTWFLDISKQAAGACYAHVLNMVIAALIAQRTIMAGTEIEDSTAIVLEDQCAWYGMSYLIDTTLGLLLAVIGVRMLDDLANERDWMLLKHSGVYTGPHALWIWMAQVMAWLWILTIVKIIIYIVMVVCSQPLAWIGKLLFSPFQGYKHFELLFVMIFFPGVLNIIYFWIADGYLKAKAEHAGAHEGGCAGILDSKTESLIDDLAEAELSYQPAAYQPTPPPWSLLSGSRKQAAAAAAINNNNSVAADSAAADSAAADPSSSATPTTAHTTTAATFSAQV